MSPRRRHPTVTSHVLPGDVHATAPRAVGDPSRQPSKSAADERGSSQPGSTIRPSSVA